VIGALVMAFLITYDLLNFDNTVQYVVKGLILLLAVWIDIATKKKA